MRNSILACLGLMIVFVNAQTLTTTDQAGNSIVVVVTSNAQGATTQTVETIPATTLASSTASSSSSTATTQAVTTAVNTPTTSPAATTAAATTPVVVPATKTRQQGPVGQPAPTTGTPGGPTPFTYTTIIGGVTSVVVDVFTPTNPATIPTTAPATGIVMDYSSWLQIYGPQTTAGVTSASPRTCPTSWTRLSVGFLATVTGGYLMMVLA